MPKTNLTLEQRFWSKVDLRGPDECWPWRAYRDRDGYGQIRVGGTQKRAHVVAWILTNGAMPEDKPCGLHHCDNPPCCNPVHIFPGTLADNGADMVAKGRQATGLRSGKYTKPESVARGSRHGRAKLTPEQVICIRLSTDSHASLGRKYNTSGENVQAIREGKRWKWLTGGKPSVMIGLGQLKADLEEIAGVGHA